MPALSSTTPASGSRHFTLFPMVTRLCLEVCTCPRGCCNNVPDQPAGACLQGFNGCGRDPVAKGKRAGSDACCNGGIDNRLAFAELATGHGDGMAHLLRVVSFEFSDALSQIIVALTHCLHRLVERPGSDNEIVTADASANELFDIVQRWKGGACFLHQAVGLFFGVGQHNHFGFERCEFSTNICCSYLGQLVAIGMGDRE